MTDQCSNTNATSVKSYVAYCTSWHNWLVVVMNPGGLLIKCVMPHMERLIGSIIDTVLGQYRELPQHKIYYSLLSNRSDNPTVYIAVLQNIAKLY